MILRIDNKQIFAYTGAREFQPEQRTIIFVHGAGLDHTVWVLQSRYFAHHGFNVLAIDLPGHGDSAGPPIDAVTALADWLRRVPDALNIDQASVVGQSMGALVGLEFAARFPNRVSRLALLGCSAPMPVHEKLLTAAQTRPHVAFDMINLWGHRKALQRGGHPVPGVWMLGSALRVLEQAPTGVLYTDLKACNRYADGLNQAASICCPVMLIQGRQDVMTPPSAAAELIAALPHPQVVILDDCGHMMMSEQPDQVLDALIDFHARAASTAVQEQVLTRR